jgi:hypothetical protein
MLPRKALICCGLVFSLIIAVILSNFAYRQFHHEITGKRIQAKKNWRIRFKKILTFMCALGGLGIIVLILKVAIILEDLINLGNFQPGWDEIFATWLFLLLTVGLIIQIYLIRNEKSLSLLWKILILSTAFVSICLILILKNIGLLFRFP